MDGMFNSTSFGLAPFGVGGEEDMQSEFLHQYAQACTRAYESKQDGRIRARRTDLALALARGPMIVDDFLPDPDAVRREALRAPFVDWRAPDGEVYRRVCITEVPGLRDRLEAVMGPVDMLGMGYRLNYAGELPNAAIHSDIGWGTHALVLYLNHDGPGGTAFWRHRATGATRLGQGDLRLLERVRDDWNDETAWKLVDLIPLKFNRAAIYEGALFHSRFPLRAFGSTPEDGRLIAIAFFTPKDGADGHSARH